MGKAENTVEQLVSQIERGELQLPEMQRRYVWKSTQVRDLVDSLYRGYPSGAILVWETDEDVPERSFAVQQARSAYASRRLLLDGQQRLTSLSALLRGEPISVRGRKRPIDLLFNLEHPAQDLDLVEEGGEAWNEEAEDADDLIGPADDLEARLTQSTFVVATQRLKSRPEWVSVASVLSGAIDDADILQRAGVLGFDDPRYKRYSEKLKRLRRVREYTYQVEILERKFAYEEVTRIFVRINSAGAKLRSSDLALAQITAKWRNSLGVFSGHESRCLEAGFPIDQSTSLRTLVALGTDQCRFKHVGSLSLTQMQEAWERAVPALDSAADFFRSNVRLDSVSLLSSSFLLVAAAYMESAAGGLLRAGGEDAMERWVLAANLKGRYSRGSSETLLDQDLTTLREGLGAEGLLERLATQFGRLDVQPGDLKGRNPQSGAFRSMFVAFRKDGATDWVKPLKISIKHQNKSDKLQFHHIFPRALLRDLYPRRVVNDICNFAFIGSKTNQMIGKRQPADYLPELLERVGPAILERQCIPADPVLHRLDHYEDFLEERRLRVADRLNRLLRVP